MEIMSFGILINVIFVAQNKDANYTRVNFYSAHTHTQTNKYTEINLEKGNSKCREVIQGKDQCLASQ